MNKPFLQQLAEKLFNEHGKQIGQVTVVFPNRRAGYFFRKYLSALIKSPIWSPEVYSIEEFIMMHSPLLEADRITLVFTLYQAYKDILAYDEGFDKFYGWGEMLLGDFDEIDRYMVEANSLFRNMVELKRIDTVFAYLTEDQRQLVRNFWRSFSGELSSEKKNFLRLWENLEKVYDRFRQVLSQQGLGYPGMIYREVANNISQSADAKRKVVFAGLNALTRSEELIISYYLKEKHASVQWDADDSYLHDSRQEAGMFLRRYRNHRVFESTFKDQSLTDMRSQPKEVNLIGVPHETGQAKKAGELLLDLQKAGKLKNPEKTVVVLADEAMLFPVLHSLPQSRKEEQDALAVNVTMGYPLRETSLYSLLEQLVEMQEFASRRAKADKNETEHEGVEQNYAYQYRHVIAILRHPLIYYRMPGASDEILDDIENRNRLSIPATELTDSKWPDQLCRLFAPLPAAGGVIPYLLAVLKDIRMYRLADLQPTGRADLELEYVFAFESHLKRLGDTLAKNSLEIGLETFLRLYRNLARFLRVPFSGEPLNGLQIMGMLETRNLDFDHVIMLNMNEGVFPPISSGSSYVPYALRRAFGLSTPEHTDAVSANVFYNLLRRAQKVTLLYNATVSTRNSGGMSRFLYQLIYERPEEWTFSHTVVSNAVRGRQPVSISVDKTDSIMSKMDKWFKIDGVMPERPMTASAINAYLDCRLRFYFRYVAGLKEADEVEEEVDQRIFGNILHEAMEFLYEEFIERKKEPLLEPSDFPVLRERLPAAVEKAFKNHYGGTNKAEEKAFRFEGRNVIAREIIMKMAGKVLDKDRQDAPFEILGLEKQGYTLEVPVNESTVVLGGIIDRVDSKDGHVRVIDYKTGKDDKKVASIESLFDREDPKRNKAAMQTFLYGFLYQTQAGKKSSAVMPGLYNVKELFGRDFSMTFVMDKHPVLDVSPYRTEYLERLGGLLSEIYDVAQPFDQTPDEDKCRHCPYKVICHRG
ncbi:PD-(D/E)XK nuclease family protein [Roseivirga sp. BDSF3-8]|uniref:PD-(D/E)XK nuclease family protein n=1 Tax=Roseivirga sp. BDSF3-8 TaxID=3241598 RepID=UPI0035322B02